MELPHELLAEYVTCLRRDFKDRLGQERRVMPRFRVWSPLAIEPAPGSAAAAFTAWVRDLSRGGVGIMYTKPMPRGTRFVVKLPAIDHAPKTVLCEVAYCAGGAPDMFSIGARFIDNGASSQTAPPA